MLIGDLVFYLFLFVYFGLYGGLEFVCCYFGGGGVVLGVSYWFRVFFKLVGLFFLELIFFLIGVFFSRKVFGFVARIFQRYIIVFSGIFNFGSFGCAVEFECQVGWVYGLMKFVGFFLRFKGLRKFCIFNCSKYFDGSYFSQFWK